MTLRPIYRYRTPLLGSIMLIWLIVAWACTDSATSYSSPTGHIHPVIKIIGPTSPPEAEFSISLTDSEGRFSRAWDSMADFPVDEDFLAATYTISAEYSSVDIEGTGKPCYRGFTEFTLAPDDTAEPVIECRLANTPVSITIDSELDDYIDHCSLELRSSTGNIITLNGATDTPVYLKPGTIDLILNLSLADGRSTYVLAASFEGKGGTPSIVTLTATGNILDIDADGNITRLIIDDALFDTRPPSVTPSGWNPGEIITTEEGRKPQSNAAMEVISSQPLRSLLLTVSAPERVNAAMPQHIDLLNPDPAQYDVLSALGLIPEFQGKQPEACIVSFRKLISEVAYSPSGSLFLIRLIAVDRSGHVSEACTMEVRINPVTISVESCSPAVIGINMADMTILAPDEESAKKVTIFTSPSGLDNTWTPAAINAVTAIGGPRYRITFSVPPSVDHIVHVRAVYIGNIAGTITINRVTPDFTLDADAFACTAKLKVKAQDESLTSIITRLLNVYAGEKRLVILSRDETTGTLIAGGLDPATHYSLKGTVMTDPSSGDFCPETGITTEHDRQIPNYDFNDVKPGIEYSEMPSGGRYSQTIAPVINRQNRTDFKVSIPDYPWANTNAKTFCRKSAIHNTWYMQPSVEEASDIITGECSVKLTSVAWDPQGQAIPDYVQVSRPYLPYNPNVPHIAFRSAGKIFIGSYGYTPSDGETYSEGITFRSRPSGLNVTYRYLPGPETPYDRGYVEVAIEGENGVIASGKLLLSPSSGFSTVNIPLDYPMFGVKASKIKVMCASSENLGTIAHESATIITTNDLTNSCSRGSMLEIKELRLSY